MLLCPAKINLGLIVPFKRNDGYHEIESLFLPVDFADELTVKPASSTTLSSENLIPLPNGLDFEAVSERGDFTKNLLFQILQTINHRRAVPLHLELHLLKRIPSGAGLGGGSSNAGALLRWLSSEGLITAVEALELARMHGADIPFFLNPVPSAVSGIGEIIETVAGQKTDARLKRVKGLLVLSDIVVSTKNAYSDLKRPLQSASQSKAGHSPGRAFQALLDGDAEGLLAVRNDFEEVVFRHHPELERVKNALQQCRTLYASMSGSGSAIYGLFHNDSDFKRGQITLAKQFPEFRTVPFGFYL